MTCAISWGRCLLIGLLVVMSVVVVLVLLLISDSTPHILDPNTISIVRQSKAIPIQAWSGPEGSRKSRFPDYMTTAQDVGRLSALRTGRLYPRKCSVKQSRYRPGVAQRVPGSQGSQIS